MSSWAARTEEGPAERIEVQQRPQGRVAGALHPTVADAVEALEAAGAGQQALRDRTAFVLVLVDHAVVPGVEGQGQSPTEAVGVLDAGVHAEAPGGRVDVGGVPGQHDPAAAVVVDDPLVHPVHREPLHVREPGGGVAGATAVELGEAVEGVVGEAPDRQLLGAEGGGETPAARLGEGEREQRPVLVEPRVDPVGLELPVEQDIREDDGLLEIGADAPERQTERAAHGAATAVRAHHPGGADLLAPPRPGDLDDDTVTLLTKADEAPVPFDAPARRGDEVGEHLLGAALRGVEQEREPRRVRRRERDAEREARSVVRLGVGDADPGLDQGVGDTEVVEDLEGPRGDARGPGGAGRRGGLVDHPHSDAAAQEVRGQREADGAGPHDEDVGHGHRGHRCLRCGVTPLRS